MTMLDIEKGRILKAFESTHKDGMGKSHPEYYAEQLAFYQEFLAHPERFRASEQALLNIHEKAFESSGDWLKPKARRLEQAQERLAKGDLKDVFVSVQWGYSSTLGQEAPILRVEAQARRADGKYEGVVDSGVAFSLSNFVERAPAKSPAPSPG